ncbi:MAG TPA: hypothetical protein VKU94_07305 [Geobacterales bacterium]|nr:hypothetical protein [Geobacterales bacterium]
MKVDKLALKLAIILAIITSILGIIIQLFPFASFSGLINGEISLLRYNLMLDNENLIISPQNTIGIRSIYSIISSVFLLLSTFYLFISYRKHKNTSKTITANSIFLGAAFVNLFASTMTIQSYSWLFKVLKIFLDSFQGSYLTSAGILQLYGFKMTIIDIAWLIYLNVLLAILLIGLILYNVIKQEEDKEIEKKVIEIPITVPT